MSSWAAAATSHFPVLLGLVIGTLARFGLEMDEGAAIDRRKVIAHLMMLGLLGLLAEGLAELTSAAGIMRSIFGAGAAIAAAKVARRFRQSSEREADRRLPLDPPQP